MTTEGLAVALLVGAGIVLVSVVGVRLAVRVGVPGLLLYLLMGLGLGTVFPGLHLQDPRIATVLGWGALIVILAQGGLTTRMSELRPVLWPAIALASVGIIVSITIVAVPLMLWVGMSAQTAILLGAVLAATDAAAVFSVLRGLRISGRVRALLEAEAGFNDAPVVVLVSVVSSGQFEAGAWWQVPLFIVLELVGGALLGAAVGYGARWLLPRLALPSVGLYPIAALALCVGAYGVAAFLGTSGFIAVYVCAILIGSAARLPHRRSIIGFSEGMAWIAEIGLFFMLGALTDVDQLPSSIPLALGVSVLIVVLARPLSAVVSLVPFRMPRSAVAFASIAGLRGAVPIVFASIPLGLGVDGAREVFDVTLLAVLFLMIMQLPLIRAAGRRLGLVARGDAQEFEVEVAPLDGIQAQVLGIEVAPGSGFIGTFVVELGLPLGATVALVVRDGLPITPDANTRIRVGDQVLIVATEPALVATEKRLREVARSGRLARWLGGSP